MLAVAVVCAWVTLVLFLVGLAGLIAKLTEAIAALAVQLRGVSAALTVHATSVTAAGSAEAVLARTVASLTETLQQPIQVETSPSATAALEHAPTKGTH